MIPNTIKQEQGISELLSRGYVQESGSNANGSYIKFSDGTMIQSGTVSCNTSSYGLITFPSAFSSSNIIMTANNIYNQSGELGLILTTQSDTTTVGVIYFRKYENGNLVTVTNTKVAANWIAIGKWK